jgi:hypothetical protein
MKGKVRGLVGIRDESVIMERELVGEVSKEERRCQSTVGIILIGRRSQPTAISPTSTPTVRIASTLFRFF